MNAFFLEEIQHALKNGHIPAVIHRDGDFAYSGIARAVYIGGFGHRGKGNEQKNKPGDELFHQRTSFFPDAA